MKRAIIFLTLIQSVLYVYSQDVLVLKNGDEITSKILEVTIDLVKYKKWDNLDGPTYSTPKSDVFMIKYQNGSKDVFKIEEKLKTDANPISREDQEKDDAVKRLENIIRNRDVGNVIEIKSFRKTNGQLKDVFGQKIYTIYFEVDIVFNAGGWLYGNNLEGFWRDKIYAYNSEPNLAASGLSYAYTTKYYPKGTQIILGCAANMNKTDNGYVLDKFNIQSERNLGIVNNTTPVQIPQNTSDSNNGTKYVSKLSLTNYNGYFIKTYPVEEIKSFYNILTELLKNYKSAKIPLYYKNVFIGRLVHVQLAGILFGDYNDFENKEEIILHQNKALDMSIFTDGIPAYNSVVYHTLEIQIEDSTGNEYFNRTYKDKYKKTELLNTRSKIPFLLTSEIMSTLPKDKDLYLNFLIRDSKESNTGDNLWGFIKFKIVD